MPELKKIKSKKIKSKKIRIGFDLDGVLIGNPPFIPKKLLEYLYRGRINHKIAYRYPHSSWEILLRRLSHLPFLRPPIIKNLKTIYELSLNPAVELFAVSGRYSFLKDRTDKWLEFYKFSGVFKEVFINEKDEKPNLFKKNMLKRLKLNYFIDDDDLLIRYLKVTAPETEILPVKNFTFSLSNYINLKILIGLSYYYPNISGLSIYAHTLATELSNRNYDITILTSRHKNTLPQKEISEKITIKRIWTPAIVGRGPIMPTFPLEAFKEVRNTDIVNIHIPSFEGVFLAFWAKLLGKKIIVTHHCDLSGWKGLLNQLTEKIVYASIFITCVLAEKIVIYTKDYADNSRFLSNFTDNLVYCLPPVKLQKTSKRLQSKPRQYNIGFAGRIAQEKGIDVLLHAIPFLRKYLGRDFKIYLAGPSKEVIGGGFLDELSSHLKTYSDHVVLTGTIKPQDMGSLYEVIDVLVLPSTQKIESFGFVQVEALLSGVPVVASDMPGVRIPIQLSDMGTTFKVGDSADLAKKIVEVLAKSKQFIKPKSEIEKIFDYKKTINFYEKIFHQ